MEKLPRKRPAGHTDPMALIAQHLPGLIVQRINDMIANLLDALDGATGGLFNLDAVADRLRGTESRLEREVVRLDNRIDMIADEMGLIQIATFGYSGRWWKPAGAYGDIVLDCIAGASGGGRSNNGGSGGSYRGGRGGYSGGWQKVIIPYDQCPPYLDIVVAETAPGATTDGGHGTTGFTTTVYAPDGSIVATATGGDSVNQRYGTGNNTFRVRGGNGAFYETPATAGSPGSFDVGGPPHEHGYSIPAGKVGVGSGAGGGQMAAATGNGFAGKDGGWPSGPGGGGGAYYTFGFAGNGGVGAAGAAFISTRISETRMLPPTLPGGLAATAVTKNTATITWTPSTDDFGVDQYEVLLGTTVVGYSETASYALTGLTPSTAYAVKVRAVDDNGNWSDFSTVLNFTTPAT